MKEDDRTVTATLRHDQCVSRGCATPTDPDLFPVVCRTCKPDVDADLDDHYTQWEPEMADLHHELLAEEAGYGCGRCDGCIDGTPCSGGDDGEA